MKISFVRHSVLNRGGDKMVLAYASYLVKKGHEVCLITNRIDTVFPINQRIKIVQMVLKGKWGTMLSALFCQKIAGIVIADIIPLAVALYLRNRRNVVYFAQDYNVTHYKSRFLRLFIIALYFFGLSVLKIRTIAVSEEISRILSKKFMAKVEKVIPNGVDTSIFFPVASAPFRAEKHGRKSILILSRSDPRKGFDGARKVAKKVMDTCTVPFEIWTVGESAEGKFPGITHRDFRYVPEPTLRVIFSSADLFLYPSHSEGFGLMVMEAFACRCPVVTTEAVPFAAHGINAMVSKIGDIDSLAGHVCWLLESPDHSRAITENGYACAHAHTLEHAKETLESTLKNIYNIIRNEP